VVHSRILLGPIQYSIHTEAVCDGSFKKGKGAAGWVIEGADDKGRITGVTAVPGSVDDHSSYGSELVGILSTLTMVQIICNLHQIQEGSITIGCNNESALENAFSGDPTNLNQRYTSNKFTNVQSLGNRPKSRATRMT
jgi:hypothetical protein